MIVKVATRARRSPTWRIIGSRDVLAGEDCTYGVPIARPRTWCIPQIPEETRLAAFELTDDQGTISRPCGARESAALGWETTCDEVIPERRAAGVRRYVRFPARVYCAMVSIEGAEAARSGLPRSPHARSSHTRPPRLYSRVRRRCAPATAHLERVRCIRVSPRCHGLTFAIDVSGSASLNGLTYSRDSLVTSRLRSAEYMICFVAAT